MRHDPVQRRYVIIAPQRTRRPSDFIEAKPEINDDDNPFLPGREGETMPEIYAVRDKNSKPNQPGWTLRVMPNKYPVLKVEGSLDREGIGVYDRLNGVGAHELVVESPNPTDDFASMPTSQVVDVLKAWRERLIDLMRDRRFRYVLVFRNHGNRAGASMSHPHSQIVALPITPQLIAVEMDSAGKYFEDKERCLFCDIMKQELRENRRIVVERDRFIAFVPYASRSPFEMTVMPRYHSCDYRNTGYDDLQQLAEVLQEALQRMAIGLEDPPYNLMLHNCPNMETFEPQPTRWKTVPYDWHWHIEIVPRLGSYAGFELGTGLYINPMAPEQAAEYLKAMKV